MVTTYGTLISATYRDWLWPAVWMLPEQNAYGSWPSSGEIDILEARGNGLSYPAQGSNYVRSSVNYGPLPTLLNQIYGWQVGDSPCLLVCQLIQFKVFDQALIV